VKIAGWRDLALANGWRIDFDPHTKNPTGKHLIHGELERIHPLGDWEGACRSIGLDEEDLKELLDEKTSS
jgi:hypothetical protein